ncbi:MAG: EAL domain-containing protein [Chloroflexota bacterium]
MTRPHLLPRIPRSVSLAGGWLRCRDQVTGLRLLSNIYPEIDRRVRRRRQVGLLFIRLVGFDKLEKLLGVAARDAVLARTGSLLRETSGSLLRREDLASLGYGGGDDFLMFLSPPRGSSPYGGQELADIAERVQRHLAAAIMPLTGHLGLDRALQVRVGYALLVREDGVPVQELVYRAVQEGRGRATDREWGNQQAIEEELISIVREGRVTTVFQPVVSLMDGTVVAYEALTRGPAESELASPLRLFSAAEQAGLLYPLERLCRQTAIRGASALPAGARLYINISPQIIEDPAFASGMTRELLDLEGIPPGRVVLEITEGHAIKDFELFKAALEHYRHQGFGIAVDDAGAGHSSLRVVAALRPEVIKIDLSLVRNIDRDRAKYALVSALVTFAKRIDAIVLGEGIETEAEMNSLIEIGVPYGQGYLLGRPEPAFQPAKVDIIEKIRYQIELRDKQASGQAISVGDVVRPAPTIDAEERSSAAEALFRSDPSLPAIVVLEEGQPVGLLSREKFFSKLGSQYGYAVFASRAVREAMNRSALIVHRDEPLDVVSRKAVHRRETDAYDHLIVLDETGLSGVVSVLDLLDVTTRRQLSTAKYSNPLSGLPGNVLIQAETERRLSRRNSFVFCHVDLNRFKHYNDLYGFSAGDGVILLLARVLGEVAQAVDPSAFVGHIGGDDFVLLTDTQHIERAGLEIAARFAREWPRATRATSREHAEADRRSTHRAVTISLAAVTCSNGLTFDEVSQMAFRAKKLAKAGRGNAFILDFQPVPLATPAPGPKRVSEPSGLVRPATLQSA